MGDLYERVLVSGVLYGGFVWADFGGEKFVWRICMADLGEEICMADLYGGFW